MKLSLQLVIAPVALFIVTLPAKSVETVTRTLPATCPASTTTGCAWECSRGAVTDVFYACATSELGCCTYRVTKYACAPDVPGAVCGDSIDKLMLRKPSNLSCIYNACGIWA